MLRRQLKLERFLPKAFSGQGAAGWRADNASNQGSRLDLFRFVPFRLNRLAAEVSAALSSEYQERYGLDIPELRAAGPPWLPHQTPARPNNFLLPPSHQTPLSPAVRAARTRAACGTVVA